MIALCLAFVACARGALPSPPLPPTLTATRDTLTLQNGFVFILFNLTRFSVDDLRGRFVGDGDFASSPNLAGDALSTPPGVRRGAVSIVTSSGLGFNYSLSDTNRASPLAYTVLTNSSASASFSVSATDSYGHVAGTLTLGLDDASPRRLWVNSTASAASPFSAALVALSLHLAAPSAQGWYAQGARQGMRMGGGYIASTSPLQRFYALGSGAQGGCEVLLGTPGAPPPSSYLQTGERAHGVEGGLGLTLWGAPAPLDAWVAGFDGAPTTAIPQGAQAPALSLQVFPNDFAAPPSAVPATLPPGVNLTDVASILIAAHGSAVAALHSYDYSPEVRAAPCLAHDNTQCYSPMYNFYDPDSSISNSAMLWTFEPSLHAVVRGQLETNMRWVCDGEHPTNATCSYGQCIHHFVANCNREGSGCFCGAGPGGQTDCALYDAISGATQTGPNIFTIFAALRYIGASGDAAWGAAKAPKLRAMMAFLDQSFHPDVGLYLAPGSLQIDVFIRQNYTADSNAMGVLLCELFGDFEASLGNASGAAFYGARAATIRSAMNAHLLADDGSHYCTQSDPGPGGAGVLRCTRDFVDYDANAIAVAAGVPATPAAAAAVLARVDAGACTHVRATYVSEREYGKGDCVNGNTGDSAVSMGRIGWQDALARQAVGGAAAAALFEGVLLAPLQRDLLARTWLPERFDCQGRDAHNAYYFEYPATVALMLFEVRYGIQLRPTRLVVRPLSAPQEWDLVLGGGVLSLHYSATAVAAALGGLHGGTRTFEWHGLQAGAWTVAATGAQPLPATVGQDGVLTFNAAVGEGMQVAATRN